MVIDGSGGVGCADREMKMLVHNRIDSLLPVSLRNIDNRCSYYYDVTSKQQFGKMYEYRKLTRTNVENILVSLDRLQNEINEYMLNLDKVILKIECIYVDTVRDRLVFAYGAEDMEEENEDFRHSLKRLFDFIIEHYDHSGSDSDVIFVYNVYQRIVQGDYDASNLKDLIGCDAAQEGCAKEETNYSEDENVMDFVADELIEDEVEVENKGAGVMVTALKVAAGLVILVAAGRMVAPSYVPLPIPDVAAFAMILIGALAFAGLSKIPVHRLTKVKSKTEAQPFTYNEGDFGKGSEENRGEEFGKEKGYGDSFGKKHENWHEKGYEYDFGKNYENEYDSGQRSGCDVGNDDFAGGATVLLSDYIKGKRGKGVCLKYKEGDNSLDVEAKEINVEKIPWIIGNMDKNCDTVIRNRLVSHIHACITKIDDEYFIEDMNSTNGTYVNGERLLMNARQKISDSDVITFAAISYIVEIS
jgi:hypothetical protein